MLQGVSAAQGAAIRGMRLCRQKPGQRQEPSAVWTCPSLSLGLEVPFAPIMDLQDTGNPVLESAMFVMQVLKISTMYASAC